MASFKRYQTKQKSNVGAKLYLKDVKGKITEDWIMVRGIDSDSFQTASRRMRQNILAFIEAKGNDFKNTEEYILLTEMERRKLQCSYVISWSFDEECSQENILALFIEAPDVAEQVDTFAGERERFAET